MTKACIECGGSFQPRQYSADFCGAPCRQAFNNRRARRGAILYDLVMIEARQPGAYKTEQLDAAFKQLVQRFQEEDEGKKRTHKRLHDVKYDIADLLRTRVSGSSGTTVSSSSR